MQHRWPTSDALLDASKSRAMIAALASAGMAYALSQTMLIPCLPFIQRSLHTTPTGVSALISAFFISAAVMNGVFGRLGDMFGKKRVMLVQMALFSGGAVVCALGSTLWMLIVGRLVMGSAVGLFPLSFSLLRDTLPARRLTPTVAILAGTVGTGAAVGQATGGLIAETLGFRWVFWLAVITGLAAALAIVFFVPESRYDGGRVDVIGAVLLAAGLALPLWAVTRVPQWGWGGRRTIGLFFVGAALLGVFAFYERRPLNPLVDLATLLSREVGLANLATLLVGFGLFSGSTILSQFFQEPRSTGYGYGAGPAQAGLFLVPGSALLLLSSPTAGRVSARVGPKVSIVAGSFFGAVAILAMSLAHRHTAELYAWPTMMYVGIGFCFGAIPALILHAVPKPMSGQSTALNMTIRNIGAAIGIQVAATIITRSSGSSGYPSDRGFVTAFQVMALVGLAGALAALAIPRASVASRPETDTMVVINPQAP